MTEEEYAALLKITTSFSPAEQSDSRVFLVSASQSTPGGEETTAPEEYELETEAPEGEQPGVGSTEAQVRPILLSHRPHLTLLLLPN